MNSATNTNKPRRWMLVDDDADILMVLRIVSERLTTATIECHNSPETALEAFAAAPGSYELVITDFEMQGMDGVEFCRRLRAISPIQNVFLTTGSGFFTEATAQRAGFGALLNKPFSPLALQEALVAAGLTKGCTDVP
jgi:CheY-like chemotaxis protein